MKSILTDAVAVANATSRAILFASRDERVKFYPDRQWGTAFVGGSYAFLNEGECMLDARTLFHYYAAGVTPAMKRTAKSCGPDLATLDQVGGSNSAGDGGKKAGHRGERYKP